MRVLYGYARSEAYLVGEDQMDLLGNPKLLIVPSPWTLNQSAFEAIVAKVREGATLLISGPFDKDPHFHSTGRQKLLGIDYTSAQLALQNQVFEWPGGTAELLFERNKSDVLERAILPNGQLFVEKDFGKGKVLFATIPLELNENQELIGSVYQRALKAAGVGATYRTSINDPGLMICPTKFPNATLYVITSESNRDQVSFHDVRSDKEFSSHLEPGRAALLLIRTDGKLLASYNWNTASGF